MKKVLVSWVATNHDFLMRNEQGEQVLTDTFFNEDGPHFSLYKDFGNTFDIHYLLSQEKEGSSKNKRLKLLAGVLRDRYKKQVVLRFMDVDDVFSVGTIKGKVEELVKFQLKEMEVEVFVNPGAPAMQIAWYLIGTELFKRDRLKFFRRRERQFVEKGSIPVKEYIEFDGSEYARVTNIRDNYKEGTVNDPVTPRISDTLKEVYSKAISLAGNNRTTVLIQGKYGTGKKYLSRYIHDISNRRNRKFLIIKGGAYSDSQFEEILYGIDKVAKGALEKARGGTIVLDEIEQLSLKSQTQLLDVLEEGVISGNRSVSFMSFDVRFFATTKSDLYQLCTEGQFRWELYYRLSIAELKLPSLFEMSRTERKGWVQYFMESSYTKLEKRYIAKLSKEVWDFLLKYQFPGNLKELSHIVETFYTFCEEEVNIQDIPERLLLYDNEHSLMLDHVIKNHIKNVVIFCGGDISKASRLLGRERSTVRKYLK